MKQEAADAIDILVDGRFEPAGAEVLLEERLFGTEVRRAHLL